MVTPERPTGTAIGEAILYPPSRAYEATYAAVTLCRGNGHDEVVAIPTCKTLARLPYLGAIVF